MASAQHAKPRFACQSLTEDAEGDRTGVPKGRQWVAGGFSRRIGAHTRFSPEGTAEAHARRRGTGFCRPFGTSLLLAHESGG